MDKLKINEHKMMYHTDRFQQRETDPIGCFPIYVEISPVGQCNHRCTFCALDYIGYRKREIPFHVMMPTLINMADNGVRSVMFAGEGEPLLWKHTAQAVNCAKGAGLDVAITTNGTLLNARFVDDCLHAVTWLKVSCNAGTPRTYQRVHKARVEDFSKVWDNLRYAVSRRRLGTTLGVQMVLLEENKGEAYKLAWLARNARLDYAVFKLYSQHKSSINQRSTVYEEEPGWVRGISDDRFQAIWRTTNDNQPPYEKCYSVPFFWAYIMATGDVYGCSAYLLDKRFNFGNINETGFGEIWRGDRRKEAIKFIESELDINDCRRNCRMDKANRWLWDVKNPGLHANFI